MSKPMPKSPMQPVRGTVSLLAVWLAVLASPGVGRAQNSPPSGLHVVAPAFFAVSVADLDAATSWYERVLGVTTVRAVQSRDGRMSAVVMRHGPLTVELIAHASSIGRRETLAPDAHDFALRGAVKVGIYVADARQAPDHDQIERLLGQRLVQDSPIVALPRPGAEQACGQRARSSSAQQRQHARIVICCLGNDIGREHGDVVTFC